MIDIGKAISYVVQYGNRIEKARLQVILGEKINEKDVIASIAQYQNPDGGYRLLNGYKSSISDTNFVLTWLSDLRLMETDNSKKAVLFLEKEQNDNGSWNEKVNNSIEVPEWRESDNHKAILYQTASTLFWLCLVSSNLDCIEKGMKYLDNNYDGENEYLHTKWLYASVLSKKYGWENHKVKRITNEILTSMEGKLASSMKTWMLWAYSMYGYSKGSYFTLLKDHPLHIVTSLLFNKDGTMLV